ncbi:MAG: hypothetical protein P9M14_09220 [Candidatus Alcyoniella australis]|nr:hypothetical protein [Candidatus Alcyoniella australis]
MRTYLCLTLIVALSLVASGCGLDAQDAGRTTAGDPWDGVDDDNYDTDDENPGFGDEEILEMTQDEQFDDPYADDPDFKNDVVDDQDVRVFNMRVVWGNLVFDPEFPEPLDYSGEISVSSGGLLVLRTVYFEAHDSLIQRPERNVVSWDSTIYCCSDGLLLQIYALPDEEQPGMEPMLNLRIGPYQREIPISDLEEMIQVEPSGAYNDAVAIAAFEDLDEGQTGFVSGRWRHKPEHVGGVFKAKWEDPDGALFGHQRGRWVPKGDDSGELRGKTIDLAGGFEGLLRGEYNNIEGNGGEFEIDWLDRQRESIGSQHGRYYHVSDNGGRGFMLGLWHLD